MALDPRDKNRMTCTVCKWTRIVDHQREYRGGHTPPGQKSQDPADDCHGMLMYELVEKAKSSAGVE